MAPLFIHPTGPVFKKKYPTCAPVDARVLDCGVYCARELGCPLPAGGFGPGYRPGSPHLAGMALDMGYGLDPVSLRELWDIAIGVFDRVQPLYLTPGWVHGECYTSDLCGYHAYPFLGPGDRGGHVFALQSTLLNCGAAVSLTGRLGRETQWALYSLIPAYAGIVDIRIWRALERHLDYAAHP